MRLPIATPDTAPVLLRRLLLLRRSLAAAQQQQQHRAFAGCGSGSGSGAGPAQNKQQQQPPRLLGLADVRAVVAVASGKGGVGKSTVAANVAAALAGRHGLRVGLLDADIHGPSVPTLMNLSGKPPLQQEEEDEQEEEEGGAAAGRRARQPRQPLMLPLVNHGVRCMSMGFFTQGDDPVVWRGPIVSSAIDRFLHGTAWGELDVLLVDMPPGTGDAQISLGQRLPLDGALVVTTPQEVALLDARRGARMFQKVRVPLLGLVANMATFACGGCGREEAIFGAPEGVDAAARELGCPVLGRVPLEGAVSAQSDAGAPVVVSRPDSKAARAFAEIAGKVAEALAASPSAGRRGKGAAGAAGGSVKITMAA